MGACRSGGEFIKALTGFRSTAVNSDLPNPVVRDDDSVYPHQHHGGEQLLPAGRKSYRRPVLLTSAALEEIRELSKQVITRLLVAKISIAELVQRLGYAGD